MGGDEIYKSVSEHLGIESDEVTKDGKVSLERIECNAACDYAPVVMVNWEFFDNQTPQSVKDFVDAAKAGNPPAPTRGPNSLRTWKENSAVLAGISDGLSGEGVSAGEPSKLGLKISKEAK
jgi:NADH-quinone oxidoreductase subunit E